MTVSHSRFESLIFLIFLFLKVIITMPIFFTAVDANGRGLLYSGILDCARKITKTEGLLAFYKGMGPSYFRQAPHTVLLLIFWDMLKDVQKSLQSKW